jgi:hypothetical protein
MGCLATQTTGHPPTHSSPPKQTNSLPAALVEGTNEVTFVKAGNRCGYYFRVIP